MTELAYTGCLVSFRNTAELLAAVDPRDLQSTGAQAAYRAVQTLFGQGRKIDPVVVRDMLDEGARDYLRRALLSPEFENAGAWQEYARIITERAQLRRVQALGLRLAQSAGMEEAREAFTGLSAAVEDRDRGDEFEMSDCIRELVEALHHKPEYMETGFFSLDRRLMVSPGDFVVVGGRPSSGKTAFTLQVAAHMAKTRRVGYFSLETGPRRLTERMVANIGGLELERILRRSVRDDDAAWRKIALAAEQLQKGRLCIVRAAGYDVARIAAKAQKLKADVIFVDYLGLVRSDGKDRYEKATNTSIALHTFAQRSGTAVFALSQLNRDSADCAPKLHDLRETGQIEQDADAVLLLDYEGRRKNPATEEYVVDIAKSKDGETGALRFRFFGATQRFYAEDRR